MSDFNSSSTTVPDITLYYRRDKSPINRQSNAVITNFLVEPSQSTGVYFGNTKRNMSEKGWLVYNNDVISFDGLRTAELVQIIGDQVVATPALFQETVTITSPVEGSPNEIDYIQAYAMYPDGGSGEATSVDSVRFKVTAGKGKFRDYLGGNMDFFYINTPIMPGDDFNVRRVVITARK